MAGARRRRRRTGGAWRWALRLLSVAVLAILAVSGWLWWDMRDWHPPVELYPEQGALIAGGSPPVAFETLRATGARFAYLELEPASRTPDPRFADRLAAARGSGLKVGAVLPFDPCLRADPQSTRFARMVPRDAALLPPAIALSLTGENCRPAVSEAAVESELTTLINQVELHAGRPVLLKLAPAFAARHPATRAITRDLWLERDRMEPGYAGRPWLLWSANSARVSEASQEPIEWVVIRN